ncbi:unnamed protein product [Pedinophyceae sp. YPF-701]|nr:unnamed protein product [Pedinophyceae sp. YPF-701]
MAQVEAALPADGLLAHADAHNVQDEAIEDEFSDFVPIDQLSVHGIGAGDIKKLKEGGFHTCQALIMNTRKVICAVKGISEAKAEKALDAAMKLVPGAGFVTGTMAYQKRMQSILHITTGCEALNEVLGGGIETQAITEVFGEYRTGKSLLMHTLAVACQLPSDMGGAAGKCAFIDTEGTFRPEQIVAIAERFGLDGAAVLDNIAVARAFTSEHQLDLIVAVAAKMAEEPFKLLVIDSIMGLLRNDFCGRGELSERQQVLGRMCARLKKLACEFNLAVVITNHVMSDPSGGMTFVVDPKKPIGGHVLAHASTVRVSLRKGKAEQRLAKVVDAPNLGEAEASFSLTAGGVSDFKD